MRCWHSGICHWPCCFCGCLGPRQAWQLPLQGGMRCVGRLAAADVQRHIATAPCFSSRAITRALRCGCLARYLDFLPPPSPLTLQTRTSPMPGPPTWACTRCTGSPFCSSWALQGARSCTQREKQWCMQLQAQGTAVVRACAGRPRLLQDGSASCCCSGCVID